MSVPGQTRGYRPQSSDTADERSNGTGRRLAAHGRRLEALVITRPGIEIHRNRRVTVYLSNEPFGSFVGEIGVDALDSLP